MDGILKVAPLLKTIRGGSLLTSAKSKSRIAQLKEAAAEKNKGLEPYIPERRRVCYTCGARDGYAHPNSSYCWWCDTDNW